MTAVLTVSPRRRRVGLYAVLLVNANVNAERLVEFLRALARHLRGPLIPEIVGGGQLRCEG